MQQKYCRRGLNKTEKFQHRFCASLTEERLFRCAKGRKCKLKQGRQPTGTQSPRFAPRARRPPLLGEQGGGCREGRGTYSRVGWEAVGSALWRAERARFPPPPAPHSSPLGKRFADGGCFCASPNLRGAARACGSGSRAGIRPHGLRPFRGAGAAHARKKSPTTFKSNRVIKNRPLEAVGFRLYFIRRPRFLRHPHPSEELQQF